MTGTVCFQAFPESVALQLQKLQLLGVSSTAQEVENHP